MIDESAVEGGVGTATGLVSIIMPVFNGQKFIEAAIKSVIDQTYDRWELIVVDDGSTDDTAMIVSSFKDDRIRYVFQQNQGASAARNHGLDVASGELITALDADDLLTKQSLEWRVAYLTSYPTCDVVYGDGWYMTVDGQKFLKFSGYREQNYEGDVFEPMLLNCFLGTLAPMLARRTAIESHGIRFDTRLIGIEDWDFCIQMAERLRFSYLPVESVLYRVHQSNTTARLGNKSRIGSLKIMRSRIWASQRFEQLSDMARTRVMYVHLVDELEGYPDEQGAVVASPVFAALSAASRALLLRLMAADYVIRREHTELARRWMGAAWRLTPRDPRVALVASLATVHPALARWALRGRRCVGGRRRPPSPFDMVRWPNGGVEAGLAS